MSMSAEKVTIGKKRVWHRKPYVPKESLAREFVGREGELRLAAAAWMSAPGSAPQAPLLVGPPGCGKGRLVFELARRVGLDLYVCQGYDNIGAEELACTLMPSDEGHGQIEYLISALATAMHFGAICFVDEIGKFPGRALSLLASILDEREYMDLDLIGERIHAHSNFRFIAATNSEDLDALPEFVRDRLFPVIRLEPPDPEEIGAIVTRQFPAQQRRIGELLNGFWRLWEESAADDPLPPTPRDAIQVFSLAYKLAAQGSGAAAVAAGRDDRRSSFALADPSGSVPIELGHLEQAMRQFRECRVC